MNAQEEYKLKLMSAEKAIDYIADQDKIVMGNAVSEPPALLKALAGKIRAGRYNKLRLFYNESKSPAGNSILTYDLLHVLELRYRAGGGRCYGRVSTRIPIAPLLTSLSSCLSC